MKKIKNIGTPATAQRGATLIVSLVILAVITIIGLASMRSSNLELRMAASARDRAVAFQAAESALAQVEAMLAQQTFPVTSFTPGCNDPICFTPTCQNGFCFSGDFSNAITRDECSLANPTAGAQVTQHWQNDVLWNLDGNPDSADVPGFVEVLTNSATDEDDNFTPMDVRFMVEFMCFVPKDEDAITDEQHSRNSGVPLFQVTVRADGEAGRSTVMLQSVFRAAK